MPPHPGLRFRSTQLVCKVPTGNKCHEFRSMWLRKGADRAVVVVHRSAYGLNSDAGVLVRCVILMMETFFLSYVSTFIFVDD